MLRTAHPWLGLGDGGDATRLRLREELHSADYSPSHVTDWTQNPILSDWTANGYLWVSVIYDDGSIQRFLDDQLGAGIVAVQTALRDVD